MVYTMGYAQYKNNKWLLGIQGDPPFPFGGSRIEFSNQTRIITHDPRSIRFSECFTGISDPADEWFVYSNGSVICNQNHDTLVNGGGLSPGGSQSFMYWGAPTPNQAVFLTGDTLSQTVILMHLNLALGVAIPPPFNNMGTSACGLNLYFSLIDPLASAGRGEVLVKNQVVLSDSVEAGNVLAVRHANGRDWWVVLKRYYEDRFYSVLVSPDSVYAPVTSTTQSDPGVVGAQASVSPDGRYYASFSNLSQLKVYDFDRCSGVMSNYRGKFITQRLAGFVSFSGNSRFLYISTLDTLWQFDMQAPDVMASQTFIAGYDGYIDTTFGNATGFWFHWLGPDGKIYIATSSQSRVIHVINKPDLPGQACDFQQHSLVIPRVNNNTIPSYVNLALYHLPGSPCDTLGVGIEKAGKAEQKPLIFPNPNDGRFSIEYPPQRRSGMLYVYDLSGKEVYREYVSPFSSIKNLDLHQELSKGMYALTLVFGNNRMMGKMVVE
jgi:hypothetical protein